MLVICSKCGGRMTTRHKKCPHCKNAPLKSIARTDIHPLLRSRKDKLAAPDIQAELDAKGIPPLVEVEGVDQRARKIFTDGTTMDGRVEKDRVAAIRAANWREKSHEIQVQGPRLWTPGMAHNSNEHRLPIENPWRIMRRTWVEQ